MQLVAVAVVVLEEVAAVADVGDVSQYDVLQNSDAKTAEEALL